MPQENVNRLVAVSGPPCSGKTTIARELASRLRYIHLEVDRIRIGILPDSTSSLAERDIAYRAMHMLASYLLNSSQSVILDATYTRPEKIADLTELAQRTATPLFVVQCLVTPEIALARFRARRQPHFAVDLTDEGVLRQAREYPYDGCQLHIDTTAPTRESINRIVHLLR
jgi:predicted kinase